MSVATPDLLMRLKLLGAPTTVSLTTSTARSTVLSNGVYTVTCDVDCFILQGGSAVDATTSSVPLWAKSYATIHVDDSSNAYVAGILSSGTGTLYITPQGS